MTDDRLRMSKALLALKRSLRAVEKVDKPFLPSTVKICPWGVDRSKGVDIFPHW
jgi:hypothetical protein